MQSSRASAPVAGPLGSPLDQLDPVVDCLDLRAQRAFQQRHLFLQVAFNLLTFTHHICFYDQLDAFLQGEVLVVNPLGRPEPQGSARGT